MSKLLETADTCNCKKFVFFLSDRLMRNCKAAESPCFTCESAMHFTVTNFDCWLLTETDTFETSSLKSGFEVLAVK